MKKQLPLLSDKTLGHLMEMLFHQKEPNPQNPELYYYGYYLRGNQKLADYPINDLRNAAIKGAYTTSTFFIQQALTKLSEELYLLQKQKAMQSAPVMGNSFSPPNTQKLDQEIKRLEELIPYLLETQKKEGSISLRDQIAMARYTDALNSLWDAVEVTKEQKKKLKAFLNQYVKAYASRELKGQGKLKTPGFYADDILGQLSSAKYQEQYGTNKTPVFGTLDGYFCHSLLYLHFTNEIKLHYLIIKNGSDNRASQWQAVVSLALAKKPQIAQSGKAYRQGLEKKWDVLQRIFDAYVASGQSDNLNIPSSGFDIKNRPMSLTKSILDGLKSENCFKSWEKEGENYNLVRIQHEQFVTCYRQVQNAYSKLAEDHQKQSDSKTALPQAKPLPKGCDWNFDEAAFTFSNGQTASFDDRNLPSAKYFDLLIKNHGNIITHQLVKKELGYEKSKVLGLKKTLKEKFNKPQYSETVKFITKHKGGFAVVVSKK